MGSLVNIYNNDNTESSKFANKQRQFGPYRVTQLNRKRLSMQLARVVDGVERRFWTSFHNAVPIVGDASRAEPTYGVPDAVVFGGARDDSLLGEAQRRAVNRRATKDEERRLQLAVASPSFVPAELYTPLPRVK